MSASMGGSNSKQKTDSTTDSKKDPWAPAVPTLMGLIDQIGGDLGNTGATPEQLDAIRQLEANAAGGNPWAGAIGGLADKAFGATSNSGMAGAAYADAKGQLGDYASGKNLDIENNPFIRKMLSDASTDAQNRVNAMFAGAGRDFSGAHQGAVAREVTKAQTPILADLYEKEQGRTIDAAKTLANMGLQTSQLMQGLDENALKTAASGIGFGDKALEAGDYGAQRILNLEQLLKDIPIGDQQAILSLIGPIAGLGGEGTSHTVGTTKGSSMSYGGGVSLI